MRSRLAVVLAALLAALVVAAPAGGSVKFGSAMLGPPDASGCFSPSGTRSCTFALTALAAENQEPGGTVAPGDGVIVSWTLRSGPSGLVEHKVRLRVVRGETGVGTGPLETLRTDGGFNSFAARLAVKAGDKLGIDTVDVPELQSVPVLRTASESGLWTWTPPLADGETRGSTSATGGSELLLNATLEPDADKDGWGDETQDKCVGQADPANACLPPSGGGAGDPDPGKRAPNTRVNEVRIEGAKATFRFSATVKGSKFKCKLDKKRWKPCKSPKVYRGLEGGRHSFKVKAIGPTGLPDPSPAKRTFKAEP